MIPLGQVFRRGQAVQEVRAGAEGTDHVHRIAHVRPGQRVPRLGGRLLREEDADQEEGGLGGQDKRAPRGRRDVPVGRRDAAGHPPDRGARMGGYAQRRGQEAGQGMDHDIGPNRNQS